MASIVRQAYYTFGFAEGGKIVSGKPLPYAFYVFTDGTYVFSYEDKDNILSQKTWVTIKKHKDLFNEMKKQLKVDF
ncbi:hypothetical protein [Bacillus sp. 1P06AnD]|uniref:hypothetical protein n=1 Tax=Bacillus sp. 1P06AnD TaxID=3132208 RepID=UPI0039A0DA9A